jgi:hypothetical protein
MSGLIDIDNQSGQWNGWQQRKTRSAIDDVGKSAQEPVQEIKSSA